MRRHTAVTHVLRLDRNNKSVDHEVWPPANQRFSLYVHISTLCGVDDDTDGMCFRHVLGAKHCSVCHRQHSRIANRLWIAEWFAIGREAIVTARQSRPSKSTSVAE